jgi:hypothetical protein
MGIDLSQYLPHIEWDSTGISFKLDGYAEAGIRLGVFGTLIENIVAEIDSGITVLNSEIVYYGLDQFNYRNINLGSHIDKAGKTLTITSNDFRFSIVPAIDYYYKFGVEASIDIYMEIPDIDIEVEIETPFGDIELVDIELELPDIDFSWSSGDLLMFQKGERDDKSSWERWKICELASIPTTNDPTIVETATILQQIGTSRSHEYDVSTGGQTLMPSGDITGSMYWDLGLGGLGSTLGLDLSELIELQYDIDFSPHLDLNSKLHAHAEKDMTSPGNPYLYRISMDSDGASDGSFWLNTTYNLTLILNLPDIPNPFKVLDFLPGIGVLPDTISFPPIELFHLEGDLSSLLNWEGDLAFSVPLDPYGITELEIKVDWDVRDGTVTSRPITIEEDSLSSPGEWETSPFMHFGILASLKIIKIFWIELGEFDADMLLKGDGKYTGDLNFTQDSDYWPGQTVDGIYFDKPGDYYQTTVYPRFWQKAGQSETFTVGIDNFKYELEELDVTTRFTGSLYLGHTALHLEHDWDMFSLKDVLGALGTPLEPISLADISDTNVIHLPSR